MVAFDLEKNLRMNRRQCAHVLLYAAFGEAEQNKMMELTNINYISQTMEYRVHFKVCVKPWNWLCE